MSELTGRRILVGVSGSIAAVKVPSLVTDLRDRGADVQVAMTAGAQRFLTPLAMQSLSGRPVQSDTWESNPGHGMAHLWLADWAEALVYVAASANLIARLSAGFADDVLTETALASPAPLLIAPAMESNMWEHPATQANVETLMERGVKFVGPVSGRLASGKVGTGRMAEPADIVTAIAGALDAAGKS